MWQNSTTPVKRAARGPECEDVSRGNSASREAIRSCQGPHSHMIQEGILNTVRNGSRPGLANHGNPLWFAKYWVRNATWPTPVKRSKGKSPGVGEDSSRDNLASKRNIRGVSLFLWMLPFLGDIPGTWQSLFIHKGSARRKPAHWECQQQVVRRAPLAELPDTL